MRAVEDAGIEPNEKQEDALMSPWACLVKSLSGSRISAS